MSDRLSPQREAEIRELHTALGRSERPEDAAPFAALDDLLFGFDRMRTELAKYVGAEPTIAEEMAYLSACLNAVHDLCNRAQTQAERWEQPLPVPAWVEQVRGAASGMHPNDPADNRHRIYIDGKGNGWISVCSDEGTEWVVPVQAAAHVEQDVRDVADDTGFLREIGRCW